MFPVLVMAGRGIKEGERIGHVYNYDIASYMAELLDLHIGYSGWPCAR